SRSCRLRLSRRFFPYTTLFRSRGLRRPIITGGHFAGCETGPGGRAGFGSTAATRSLQDPGISVQRACITGIPDQLCHEAEAEERSEEHTSELQSRGHLVCRLLL